MTPIGSEIDLSSGLITAGLALTAVSGDGLSADKRIARGIVLVPRLPRGAFLATAAWGQGPAADNRWLAVIIDLCLAGGPSQLGSQESQSPSETQNSEQ